MSLESKIEQLVAQGVLSKKLAAIFKGFSESYLKASSNKKFSNEKLEKNLEIFFSLVQQQLLNPFAFEPYHQRITSPVDYTQFSLDLIRPLIDFPNSKLVGLEIVDRLMEQLKQGENVVLLANHQIEPDPQVILLHLIDRYPELVERMVFVAGDRVTTDPLAVPFSKGCNLLCIYSKKRMESPPEQKLQKQLHNQKAVQVLKELFTEGGKCIYVAPSGGRDRKNSAGEVEVAAFDPDSIELFWLISRQARTLTHFYPLALATYWILPPPDTIDPEIGEERKVSYQPAHLAFGEEIEMQNSPGEATRDKLLRRQLRAEHIWSQVNKLYTQFFYG